MRVLLLAAAMTILFAASSQPVDVNTLRKRAEAGDAKAQFDIGSMYEQGIGVRRDYAEAARWYRKAGDRGDRRAQYNLGIFCQNGWGVPRSDAEAVKWYRKAAAQGMAAAQYNLGHMYHNGLGVPKDLVQSHYWFSLAEPRLSGVERMQAAEARDRIAKEMTPGQLKKAQAMVRSREAPAGAGAR